MAFVLVVNLRIKQDCVPQFMAECLKNARAFEAHQQTPHFKRYMANALQYLESRERQVFGRVAP